MTETSSNATDPDLDGLLTPEDVAVLCKVEVTTVYSWSRIKDKKGRARKVYLPSIKAGKFLRFEEAKVLEWLKKQRRGY